MMIFWELLFTDLMCWSATVIALLLHFLAQIKLACLALVIYQEMNQMYDVQLCTDFPYL